MPLGLYRFPFITAIATISPHGGCGMGARSVAHCRWAAAHHATFVLRITFILACAMHRARRDHLRTPEPDASISCANVCTRYATASGASRLSPRRHAQRENPHRRSAEYHAHTWQRPVDEGDLAASCLRRSRMSPITSTTVSDIKMTNPRQAAVVSATVRPSITFWQVIPRHRHPDQRGEPAE